MHSSTISPLSPRVCRRLAIDLLDADTEANTLWAVDEPGATPVPRFIRRFEFVDDLMGTLDDRWRGLAIVIDTVTGGDGRRLAYVQSSCGCSSVAVADGDNAAHHLDTHGGIEGFLHDLARRILGLDTLPEPTPPSEVMWQSWVTRVFVAASDPLIAHQLRTWDDVVALHPVIDAVRSCGYSADRSPTTPDETALVQLAHAVASGWSWERLRMLAMAGATSTEPAFPWRDDDLTVDEIAWMDTGMFARWWLSVHQRVDEVLNDCSFYVDPALLKRVLCAVSNARRL